MMLDKKRSFCEIIGDTENGARFLQDGKEFDAGGKMIGEGENIARPGVSLISDEMLQTMKDLAASTPKGCFVEVGVYRGGSAKVLYELGRKLFLYDTFSGIPVCGPEDQHSLGDFADCSYDDVCAEMPKAHVIKGVFPESLVKMPKVAFVHADADQYESTANICKVFPPLMAKGGMILFDDYRSLPGCVKAVDEFFPEREKLPDGRALVRF